MVQQANPARGEAMLRVAGERYRLGPALRARGAAGGEGGSLFAWVEGEGAGGWGRAERGARFWQVSGGRPEGGWGGGGWKGGGCWGGGCGERRGSGGWRRWWCCCGM